MRRCIGFLSDEFLKGRVSIFFVEEMFLLTVSR